MSTMGRLAFVHHPFTFDTPCSSFIYSLGCWVLPKYQTEQILSEYLWVWVTGLSMLLLYFAMYFILKLGPGGWVNGIPCK